MAAPQQSGQANVQPRPIYVVLGTHRSGSSLCAHLMQALGFDMSDEARADAHNEKGYWEHPDIMLQQDLLLNVFGRNFYHASHALPLPHEWWKQPVVEPIKESLKRYLTSRMALPKRLAFKDPRTVHLLPLWFEIFKELSLTPKFIMCLRNPAQVARSLRARDGFNLDLSEFRWIVYAMDFFRYTVGHTRCVIEYDDWFVAGMPNLKKLTDFLDLPTSDATAIDLAGLAAGIVDPALRHGAATLEARNSYIRDFYNLTKRFETDPQAAASIAATVEQFELVQDLMRPFEPIIEAYDTAPKVAKVPEPVPLVAKHRSSTARLSRRARDSSRHSAPNSPLGTRAVHMTRAEIVNALARKRGYSRYLEVSTPRTGSSFGEIDRDQLPVCRRLMYKCPDDYDDGFGIDFRTSDTGIRPFFDAFRRDETRFDVIYADPWPTYECSLRDLAYAFAVLAEGGVLVVRDCNPPSEKGVMYAAFADFVLDRDDIDYYTVDADSGCGIIKKRKLASPEPAHRVPSISVNDEVRFFWDTIRRDETLRYSGFQKVKRHLLRLVSVAEFLEMEALERPQTTPA